MAVAALPVSATASAGGASWAKPEIELVAAHGLLGGEAVAFRPDDPLSAGDLAELVAGLTGATLPAPADPTSPVTIAQLDAALVRGEGLAGVASRFAAGLRAAGLKPPMRLGTEVVARILGFRTDHPSSAGVARARAERRRFPGRGGLLRRPRSCAGRDGKAQYVTTLATSFAPPEVTGWQQTILQQAISLVGYPVRLRGHEREAAVAARRHCPRRIRLLGARLARLQTRRIRSRNAAR